MWRARKVYYNSGKYQYLRGKKREKDTFEGDKERMGQRGQRKTRRDRDQKCQGKRDHGHGSHSAVK